MFFVDVGPKEFQSLMMGKRKGNVEPFIISANSKGKRMRENGRLKIQDDDSDLEEMHVKLLRDAGVDEEMMKTIPEIEKQEIIKAICESKTQPSTDVIVSSPSDENKESSSASPSPNEDEVETQPPDDFVMSETPSPLHPDTQSEGKQDGTQEVEIPLEKTFRGRTQLFTSSDNLNNSTSLPERNVVSFPCDEDVTQPYHLEESLSAVLAVETQFCPSHGRVRDGLNTIPESPSPPSLDNEDEEVDEKCSKTDCRFINESNFMKSRTTNQQEFPPKYSPERIKDPSIYTQVIKLMFDIYTRRLRSVQNCLKGKSVQWGKPVRKGIHCENSLRREVLDQEKKEGKSGKGRRLMRRRPQKENNTDTISSERSCNKNKNPQNSFRGISNELLPLTVIDDDDEEERDDNEMSNDDDFDQEFVDKFVKNKTRKIHILESEKTGNEGRRESRYITRNQARENDSADDLSTDKMCNENRKYSEGIMKRRNMFKDIFNESAYSPTIVDTEKLDEGATTNCTYIDQEFLETNARNKKKRTSLFEKEDFSDTKSKSKKKSPIRNITNCPEEEQDFLSYPSSAALLKKKNDDRNVTHCPDEVLDLPPHHPSSTILSSKQKSDTTGKMTLDIEVLDDDEERYSRDVSGSWLSSKKGKEIKTKVGRRQNKRTRDRPDSPLVEAFSMSILKRKGRKVAAKPTSTLSKVVVAEDICIIDDNGDSSSLPEVMELDGIGDNKDKARTEKCDNKSAKSLTKGHKTEDLPSSLESGYFLDPQGDMYCTQFDRKAKEAMKRKSVDRMDEEIHQTLCQSTSKFVVISSGGKKKGTEVDEITIHEVIEKREKTKRLKGIRKQSDKKKTPQGEDSNLINMMNLDNDNYATNQDNEILNESTKAVKPDLISSNRKDTGKNTRLNKKKERKRTLFDVDINEESEPGVEDAEITIHDNGDNSNISEKTKRLKRRQKQSDKSGEPEGEDSSPTNIMSFENDHYSINQDNEILNESTKNVKPDFISSSNQKVAGKNTCLKKKKKRKRMLFDVDISEESESTILSDDVSDRKEAMGLEERDEQSQNPGMSREVERIHCEGAGEDVQLSLANDHMETNVDKGTCPICEKMFLLTDLEAHASTCGEGEQVNAEDPMVKCMICHKEIGREIMKEHQAHCANVEQREEPPSRRRTRAKKSGRQRFVLRNASPSSSGEDYGELYMELDNEKK